MGKPGTRDDFKDIRPSNISNDVVETPIYVEHKRTRYSYGGDCAYILRVKYFVHGMCCYEYMIDKEILPDFRKYLEKEGFHTSLRENPANLQKRKALRPRTGFPNPGFAFPYNGVLYSQCLACEPDKTVPCYYICNPNYRLRIGFTVPGDTASRARITDEEVYAWLKEFGYILKELGEEEYNGKMVPVVKFDAARLTRKGRMALLFAKKELKDDFAIREESFLYNLMSFAFYDINRKYKDKIELMRFKYGMLSDENPAAAAKLKKELTKLETIYHNEEDKVIRGLYIKANPDSVFVKRFFVDREDVIVDEENNIFSYRFKKDSALDGYILELPLKFLERPKTEGRPWSIALEEGKSQTLRAVNGKDSKATFKKLESVLNTGIVVEEDKTDEQGDAALQGL